MSASELQVTIKAVPAVRVLALRATMPTYRSQTALWDKVCGFATAHSLAITGPCFTLYYDPEYRPSDVDLEVCLPIATDAAVPKDTGDIVDKTLPALPRAASTIHHGTFDKIPAVYDALHQWIVEHKERAIGPDREVCLVMDLNDTTEESFVTEIQVEIA
ncbi:hypothetical protein ATCC90586_011923 [Pythium insidiosum]|nr:hypothetical protein ATCC90586_011923 [Pythium insidiosum]